MFEDALSAAIRVIQGYTAVRAWAVEVLAVFVVLTVGRFGLAVWMFDMAASGAGAGYVPGWVPAAAAVGLVAGEAGLGAGGAPWWVAWLYAYDNLRAYAENAIILGMIFAFVFEGGIMFLARKRIRISKEEGHAAGREEGREEGHKAGREAGREEGREEGHKAGREAERAELMPQLDAAEANAARAEATAARAEAAAAQAAAQATAQAETMQAEIRLMQERQALRDEEVRMRQALRDEEVRILRERQALRDEENRLLRERVSQLENGNAGNGGNGNGGAGNDGNGGGNGNAG